MPEEVLVVLVMFILFVLAPRGIFKGIKSLRESNTSRDAEGSAMRRSELQAMIDDAVIEATAPLQARLDELEHELLLGEGRIAPETLAEALDDPEVDEANPGRARQRV